MAIGTSITPRSYNVDVTGKDYTLSPEPLQRALHDQFQSQRETQDMVHKAALAGVDTGKYLAARHQAARVKAQLADLPPDAEDFQQRYAQIVYNNPLAFTDERVAPVTAMAVKPLVVAAAQAQQDRAALLRAETLSDRQAASSERILDRQIKFYDHRRDNPMPTKSTVNGGGIEWLDGNDPTKSPVARPPLAAAGNGVGPPPEANGGAQGDGSEYLGYGSGNALFYGGPPAELTGKDTSTQTPLPPLDPNDPRLSKRPVGAPLPPGYRWTKDGAIMKRTGTYANGTPRYVAYDEAAEAPAVPEGQVAVPKLNPGTNVPSGYTVKDAPKPVELFTPVVEKKIDLQVAADPDLLKLSKSLADAEGAAASAKALLQGVDAQSAKGPEAKEKLSASAAFFTRTAAELKNLREERRRKLKEQALSEIDPKFSERKGEYKDYLEKPDEAAPVAPAAPAAPTKSVDEELDDFLKKF